MNIGEMLVELKTRARARATALRALGIIVMWRAMFHCTHCDCDWDHYYADDQMPVPDSACPNCGTIYWPDSVVEAPAE